ncbi:nuclear transport factor 2 family protein [Ideonella livida]|uniref:Steroid delta-isomerase n=1 Tax=Ideonella livida TaxID=2707176 RepID=A0A7C9TK08_9BURK|nr:nuclear transport factor 2 family protein [Ideonella livida]NDY92400.1 steroid delta-isomerase [Ideonella livida]
MPQYTSPAVVVQRQLDAYNAKNLEAWLDCYAEDAKQFELGGALLAEGHAQIRARTAPRFLEPHLHAHLLRREVMGHVVIDHEDVTRSFPEGPGSIELVCVYVVERGKIQSASFAFGPPTLHPVSGAIQA